MLPGVAVGAVVIVATPNQIVLDIKIDYVKITKSIGLCCKSIKFFVKLVFITN